MTVRDRMSDTNRNFTPSELKVIRELWSNYPAAGLTTVSRLAKLAGVSDPTVIRLANKLGFAGFVELQQALLSEVEEHSSYPLMALVDQKQPAAPESILASYLDNVTASLRSLHEAILPVDFESAVALLTDRNLRIRCLGGRFSRYLAAILRVHLQLIRPDTELMQGSDSEMADSLVDGGPRDVIIVYDFRRYQTNVIQLTLEAVASGAKAILITDRWRSPIAKHADIVFALAVETVSPFDTMTPGLLLTEALIAAAATQLRSEMSERMETMERFRSAHQITLEALAQPAQTIRSASSNRKPKART